MEKAGGHLNVSTQICEAYASGVPAADIAAQFDRAITTVCQIAHRAGHRRQPTYRWMSQQTRDMVAARYRAGDPIKNIAADAGVSLSTVSRVARNEGMSRRGMRRK